MTLKQNPGCGALRASLPGPGSPSCCPLVQERLARVHGVCTEAAQPRALPPARDVPWAAPASPRAAGVLLPCGLSPSAEACDFFCEASPVPTPAASCARRVVRLLPGGLVPVLVPSRSDGFGEQAEVSYAPAAVGLRDAVLYFDITLE